MNVGLTVISHLHSIPPSSSSSFSPPSFYHFSPPFFHFLWSLHSNETFFNQNIFPFPNEWTSCLIETKTSLFLFHLILFQISFHVYQGMNVHCYVKKYLHHCKRKEKDNHFINDVSLYLNLDLKNWIKLEYWKILRGILKIMKLILRFIFQVGNPHKMSAEQIWPWSHSLHVWISEFTFNWVILDDQSECHENEIQKCQFIMLTCRVHFRGKMLEENFYLGTKKEGVKNTQESKTKLEIFCLK